MLTYVCVCCFCVQGLANECSNHSYGSLGSSSDKESEVTHTHWPSFDVQMSQIPRWSFAWVKGKSFSFGVVVRLSKDMCMHYLHVCI